MNNAYVLTASSGATKVKFYLYGDVDDARRNREMFIAQRRANMLDYTRPVQSERYRMRGEREMEE